MLQVRLTTAIEISTPPIAPEAAAYDAQFAPRGVWAGGRRQHGGHIMPSRDVQFRAFAEALTDDDPGVLPNVEEQLGERGDV